MPTPMTDPTITRNLRHLQTQINRLARRALGLVTLEPGDSIVSPGVFTLTDTSVTIPSVDTAIADERAARVGGDSNIVAKIDADMAAERLARVNGDGNLRTDIDANEADIEQKVADEKLARWNGDNNLSTRITSSQKSANEARAQADDALRQLQLVEHWLTDTRQKLADKGITVSAPPPLGPDVSPY